jgi:DNA-binding PadR family transcriptional regulator
MTNAELAILSLVAEKPRHGYEIEQVIEGRGMREWTEIGFSSIYYLLRKLEDQGLIEGRLEEADRGPARKVFHPTAAGREALQNEVFSVISQPQKMYSPLLLGLSNLPRLKSSEVITAFHEYRSALDERMSQVRSTRDRQRPLPYFVEAMFDYSLTMIEAQRNWTDRFILELERVGDSHNE